MRDTRESIEKQKCELMSTCPFFNDEEHSDMTESLKEEFCYGNYTWCGRYLIYQALRNNERDRHSIEKQGSFKQNSDMKAVHHDEFTRL
jgi:hypothetical protein